MRRLPIALLCLGALLGALSGLAPPARAQTQRGHVDVIEVRGMIDAVVVDFIGDALRSAERERAEALVLQVDSSGGVADDADVSRLVRAIAAARVPVVTWVGGSGSPRAYGDAFRLVDATDVVGVAPGARLGLRKPGLSGLEALRSGMADLDSPTLGNLVVSLDGRRVDGQVLETARVVRTPGEQPRREPTVAVRFAKPGLVPRLLHAVSSPSIAYLLLVAGLLLVVFEFFTAGIGLAAGVAVIVLALSGYGLAALPTRPWALALVAIGVLGFTIDLQAGAPRTWTVLGTVALAVGSVRLYGDGVSLPLWVMAAVLAASALAMVSGMPAMVRARFSTPTIGRESMVGDLGVALDPVAPEGRVEVRGAPWRARTNRATPIEAGDRVRVVGIDGLLLEVEPEAGGATDYRH
jgi:membrane-bound serine protease (ClpP class)